MTTLGGPGVACSTARVRRLEAGELAGEERARSAAHVAGCARCRATVAELAREREVLAASLPFDRFAAGVAERLARPAAAPPRIARRIVPLAIAAGLAAAVVLPAVLRPARDPGDLGERAKGGAALTVYARAGAEAHALAPGEAVPPGAALRLGLAPAGRAHAAVLLVDADGAAPVWAGPAAPGLLPGAFEWTGEGEGTLVLVLDDAPVDAAAAAARIVAGGIGAAAPRPGAEVVTVPLVRGRP